MDNNENFEVQQKQPKVEQKVPETVSTPSTPEVTPTQAPDKAKKPIHKKWWFWVIIGVLIISIIVGGGNNDSNGENPGTNDSSNNGTNNDDSGSSDNDSNNDSQSNLGNYHVVIDSYRLAEDYQGNPIIIVKYKFTNNSSDAASFFGTLSDTVYQNGVGLNKCYLTDDSANYSSDNQTKEIKTGVTLDVEVAYELNDETTPIEVEVSRYISFNNKMVTKTFTISNATNKPDNGNNNNQNSSSNQNSTTSNLGQYNIVIDSYRLAEDMFGKPIIIVKYKFTNNSSNSAAFWTTVDDNVYQNGVGLNECYFTDDSANYSSDNQTKEIKTGVTLDVEVAYELNDETTTIEVEVTELISFSNKKVTKIFNIN